MAGEAARHLQARKDRLLARSAALRGTLVREAVAWERPLGVADGALVVARWVHAQRWWLLGAGALLLATRPRRALRWLRRGWWLWRVSRRLRPWVAAALSLRPPTRPPHRQRSRQRLGPEACHRGAVKSQAGQPSVAKCTTHSPF